jgi:acyl-lipid omega-6 desaturase (Delta-12 desaturase)
MASSSNGQAAQSPGSQWPAWHAALAAYRDSDPWRSSWQVISALVPYGCFLFLMVRSVQFGYPYALTLVLAVLAAAFLVRIFILFHDCVHGSLFRIKEVNTFFGYLFGLLVFTPFEDWRFSHLRHHVSYANLDARGYGDIWTMTRTEFENSSKGTQWLYRACRNPVVLIGLGALFSFLLRFRIPTRKTKRKERVSVVLTNLLILAVVLAACRTIGWRTYLLVQLPVVWMAGAVGIWLFYVQHQFEGGYWVRQDKWDPIRAALEGSSFYQLPAVLRWFSGNIGYHHVHHLGPRIPNYRIPECFSAVPELQAKQPVALAQSLSFVRLKLWDETLQKLVPFPAGR